MSKLFEMDYNTSEANLLQNLTQLSGKAHLDTLHESLDDLTLDYLNSQEIVRRLVPLVYLAILALVGIPGNLLIIYIYIIKFQRKATHRTFVVSLAVADLMVCCFTIPFEIFQMTREYTFNDKWTCKCGRTVNAILTTVSVLILVALSVNRYLRICHPLRIQLTYHQALKVIACIMFISVLVSWPVGMFTGLKKHYLQNNITGSDCSNSPDFENTSYPTIYGIGLLVVYSFCMVLLFILCILLGRNIFRHIKFVDQFTITKTIPTTSCLNSGKDGESELGSRNSITKNAYSCKKYQSKTDKANSPVNITRTALSVCITFIIVFLPYVVINLMAAITKGHIMPPSRLSSILLPTLSRTHFVNNVVNFVIYICMDSSFRRHCKACFLSAAMKCKKW